jgi:trigger factor
MIGLKENEQKTIEVTFPSDYPQKDLAGKKANFELKIKKISTRKMPDLNDEYIASLQIPNVSNLTQLKDFVKKDITIKKENYNKQLNVEKIVNFLIKNAKIEFIPEKMISYESEKIFHQYQSQAKQYGISIEQFINFQGFSTIDDFNKMIDVTASENVSYSLVIDKISEEMKLTISDSESEEYYKAVAQQYRISVEELKKIITKNDEMLETIEISILRNKTLEELLKLNSKE